MKIIVNANHPDVEASERFLKHPNNERHNPRHLRCLENFYSHLLLSLNYPLSRLPVGELLRQSLGLEGRWVIASPVHWEATHNDAMLLPVNQAMPLNESVYKQLYDDFVTHFQADEFELHYFSPTLWLLRCDNKPLLKAKPPAAISHQSLMPELKQLDETMKWQGLITETQMFFSQASLTQGLQKDRAINGLWFWGDGDINLSNQTMIVFDKQLFEHVSLLSSQVTKLTFDSLMQKKTAKKFLNREAILLFQQLDLSQLKHLEESFKAYSTEWYWNNTAYGIEKPSLFARLWRHL